MHLPSGWKDITIAQFLKYYTLNSKKFEDLIDFEVELIACLGDTTKEEVEKIKARDLKGHAKKLSFLKTLPQRKIPYSFTLAGQKYRVALTMGDMTAGQFMNFSDVLKGVKPDDYVYEMHKLIACMCVRRTRGVFIDRKGLHFSKYEYDGYSEAAEVFLNHMTMDMAYPFYVFFCKQMERLYPATQSYLEKELRKLKKPQGKKGRWWEVPLKPIGGGTRSLTASATTT